MMVMGLRTMLLLLLLPLVLACFLGVFAQPPNAPRDLDTLLQNYAFRAFVRPKTGVLYDGFVPSNLSGIQIAAIRLRSGSLRKRGFPMYKEFHIPSGLMVRPYVERLVLVYQNLGNWSVAYYPLPNYTYLTPVLGLLAYSASNLSATNLPQLEIQPSEDPISIRFSDVKSAPMGSVPKCVMFDLQGLVSFSNANGNVCSTSQQGHFSLVVESGSVSPSPSPPSSIPPSTSGSNVSPGPSGVEGKKKKSRLWIIIGSVLGGLLMLVFLSFLVIWVHDLKQRKEIQRLERAAELGEALHMTPVGESKAPAAAVTRTQPRLETEYVP
ncbi:hypothetical protein K2173_008205 [Erythroxylum novogranatense]|uniref:Transmembrane protein n=1 Tax=Erythroxylum novogranatense TaxID=1862640 RepID=A0AAV8U8Z4_9ROSI|nr:hypothetical protein K2173_008205 [Erythroxylum novogranatense]